MNLLSQVEYQVFIHANISTFRIFLRRIVSDSIIESRQTRVTSVRCLIFTYRARPSGGRVDREFNGSPLRLIYGLKM